MTIGDVPKLRKVLEHITNSPWTWNQSLWTTAYSDDEAAARAKIYRAPVNECGTVFCVAGHVANLDGVTIPLSQLSHQLSPYEDLSTSTGEHISEYAARVLGLNDEQAARLFDAENSIADVWYLANLFSDGEIEVPPTIDVTFTKWGPFVKSDGSLVRP